MSFRYKVNILEELKKAGYSSTRLRKDRILGESYMTKLRSGEMVSWAALDTICSLLSCQLSDIIEHTED